MELFFNFFSLKFGVGLKNGVGPNFSMGLKFDMGLKFCMVLWFRMSIYKLELFRINSRITQIYSSVDMRKDKNPTRKTRTG